LIFNKKFLKIIDKLFGILMPFYYLYYVLKMKDMSLPFNLNSVLATASLIEGFDVVRNAFPVEGRFTKRVITYSDAVYEALNDVAEDYSDWPEDQGFGSSDMTYVRKSFIDSMISLANLNGYYQTDFKPYLKVVEYSEFDKEEYDLRREQGI
jgi:hypothetical protein